MYCEIFSGLGETIFLSTLVLCYRGNFQSSVSQFLKFPACFDSIEKNNLISASWLSINLITMLAFIYFL